jgi:hypothetical protein
MRPHVSIAHHEIGTGRSLLSAALLHSNSLLHALTAKRKRKAKQPLCLVIDAVEKIGQGSFWTRGYAFSR